MIKVRLFGGIKKLAGSSNLIINNSFSTVGDLLEFIENTHDLQGKLNDTDVMVVLNGIEFSVLGGRKARVSHGDNISIVSIVHGG